MAVPAYPYKIIVKSYEGKDVAVYMQGDEYVKFAITEDGYTLLNDVDGWWYAEEKEDGKVGKSSYRLLAYENETRDLKAFKLMCPKKLIPNSKKSNINKKSFTRTPSGMNVPVIGNKKALVILMQYKDFPFKHSQNDFEKLFNAFNYNEGGATGSVRDYYRFASQSQLDYESDIYGPYTAKYPMSYYGRNDQMGNDQNPIALCKEALENLPQNIDLSVYDNNNDGIIDNVHIIFAGYGEESGAASDAIWSHEHPRPITVSNGQNITIAGYSCSPELRGNMSADITHIGVICHELGHALGAMDYYDTNYGTGGEYLGTGKWDIMASGSWNDDGKNPANFNPYVRSTVFGWNEQMPLSSGSQIVMPRMDIDNAANTIIYRMDTESKGDYFLLENRQKWSFDKGLPGEGLMIYHIHPNIDKLSVSNSINASHPQCMYPVCASGSLPDKMEYGNINTGECPFPGLSNNRSFSPITNPSAMAWDGSTTMVTLSCISVNSSDGSVRFTTGTNGGTDPIDPETPDDGKLIYKESFEKGIDELYCVESIMGKEVWRTYKKGAFILNPTSVPLPTDGENILMLYSPKGGGISESIIKSPEIGISSSGIYILSLDIYCDSRTTKGEYSFFLSVENDKGTLSSFRLKDFTEGWMNVRLPLSLTSENIWYNIRASIMTGGIFVDNICLISDNNSADKLEEIYYNNSNKTFVYTLNGLLLGEKNNICLCPGFYILKSNGNARIIRLYK